MAIAIDQQYRFGESGGELDQLGAKFGKTRMGFPHLCATRVPVGFEHIGLNPQNKRLGIFGGGKALIQPFYIGRIAGHKFIDGAAVTDLEVVVRSGDMGGDKGHVIQHQTGVFGVAISGLRGDL